MEWHCIAFVSSHRNVYLYFDMYFKRKHFYSFIYLSLKMFSAFLKRRCFISERFLTPDSCTVWLNTGEFSEKDCFQWSLKDFYLFNNLWIVFIKVLFYFYLFIYSYLHAIMYNFICCYKLVFRNFKVKNILSYFKFFSSFYIKINMHILCVGSAI